MAIQHVIDLTSDFNTGSQTTIEIGGWDYCILHFESASGTITFGHSNDSGGVTGITDGSPATATAFQPVQGTNLANGVAQTSHPSGSALYRLGYIGRFLQLTGTDVTVGRLLVRLFKIH
jgi:hypothetical protein